MKHDPEVKIFYSDRNCYISQEISNTTCRWLTSLMKPDILLQYITWLPNFLGTVLKNTLGKSILLAKSKEYTLLYVPNKFQDV